MNLYIDYALCEGCGACQELYPDLFEMRDSVAWVINHESFEPDKQDEVVNVCIYGAISVESSDAGSRSHGAPTSRGRSSRRGR